MHILPSAVIACAFSVLANLKPVRYTTVFQLADMRAVLCNVSVIGPPFISLPKTPYKVV